MDNQNRRKNHTAGHDNHGVHLCRKCGWPFPNPHPSAKHRRAHKKICGTIEGYEPVDSEGSTHSTLSDDEHVSDEDHKTPSPHILGGSNDEKGIAGLGKRSNRSEDEVFADAVAEFSDSGSGRWIEESSDDVKKPVKFVETIMETDTKTALSFGDPAVTAGFPCSRNLADSNHMQNTEVQGNYLSENALECKNEVSSVTIGSVERSLTDYRTEESGCESIDEKQSSTCNSNPIQHEIQTDVSQENMEETASQDLAETDVKGNEAQNREHNAGDDLIKVRTKANEGTHLDAHLLDAEVAIDSVIEASEAVSRSGIIENIISDAVLAAGVIQLKEQSDNDLDSKKSLNVLSPEVESVEHVNTYISTTGGEEHTAEEMASAVSGKLSETDNEEGETNDNFHLISVPGDLRVVENAEIMIKDYKDHKAGRTPQLVDADSFEVINNVKDSDLEDNRSNLCLSFFDEGTQGGKSEHIVGNFLDETELYMPQVKVIVNEGQGTEGFPTLKEAAGNEVEKSCTVQCPQDQLRDDYCHFSSESISSEHATGTMSDMTPVAPVVAEVRQTTNLIGMDDAGDHGKDRIKGYNIAGNEEVERISENSCTGNILRTPENPSILSEVEVHGRTKLFADENAADHEKGKVESETETGEGSVDGSHLVKTAILPESATDLHETCITSKNVVNASEINISEPESRHLSRASDNQVSVMDDKPNRKGKVQVQVDDVDRVSAAGESDNVGDSDELHKSLNNAGDIKVLQKPLEKIDDFEVLPKSSEENMIKEPQHYPLDALSSIQNSDTIGDNPAGDFVRAASKNQSESFPDEGENKLVAQQANASATDFSVDSGSQTDSLEGHWGSVSVLSTQSDMQATVDTEHLASNGSKAEKAEMEKPKALLGGHPQSDNSEIFEPPSFMTLVEPRTGTGDKAAASEMLIAQDLRQPKAMQAGWFPSLTHVVNESEGRKKNEKIIAKVTNWSTGKQHIPLKNLMGDTNTENKSKLSNAKENHPPVVQKDDESSAENNGASAPTVTSIVNPQMPLPKPVKKDAGKEWNSPARYPADIKREKTKVKGRSYWAQFVCCSSVN